MSRTSAQIVGLRRCQSFIRHQKIELTILNDLSSENVVPDPNEFPIRPLEVCRHQLHLRNSVCVPTAVLSAPSWT